MSASSRRRIFMVCLAVLGLGLLLFAGSFLIVRQQRVRWAIRVEGAVRASFDGFCDGPNERLEAQISALPVSLSLNRYWDIRCEPDSWVTGPAMTIDIQTCSVLVPQYGIPEWPQVYGSMFVDGQKLTVCP